MKALTNDRNLQVKVDVKNAVLKNAEYKTMYSNVLKRENKLRLKFYDLKGSVATVVENLKALNVGEVSKVGSGTFGLKTKPVWSVVVLVDAENVK